MSASRRPFVSFLRVLAASVTAFVTVFAAVAPTTATVLHPKTPATALTVSHAPTVDTDWPNEIYGTVLDDFGDPAVDLQIDAVNSAGTIIDTVYTDTDGWYNFFDLPPATYKLHFVGDSNYEDEWYEDVYTRNAGTALAVSNTQGYVVDAEVTWIGGSGGGMGGDAAFEGIVSNRNDEPLENVDVIVFDQNGDSVSSASSDVDGYYLANGLVGGQYTLCFDSTDFPFTCLGGTDDPLAGGTQWHYVSDGETAWIDYQLTLSGAVNGIVTDSEGVALEGIQVSFYVFDDGGWSQSSSVTTDADGAYSANVPEGYYRVVAYPQDSASTFEPQWWSESSSSKWSSTLQVSASFANTGVDFSLREGSAISVNVWCGSTGTECAGTPQVTLYSLDGTLVDDQKALSGSEVEFVGIPAGRYLLQTNDAYWGGDGTYPDAELIYVEEGQDITGITQVFPNGPGTSTISGTVTLAGAEPAAGYAVALWQALADGSISEIYATTDESGYYEFAGVESGEYTLSFTPPADCVDDVCDEVPTDYWGRSYTENRAEYFTVSDGAELTNLDFEMLPRTSRIIGTVRNSAGVALQGVEVLVYGPNGSGSATTAANGTYTITGLAPGIYTAYWSRDGYVSARIWSQTISRPSATVALGATGTINLTLAPAGARIAGRVTGSDAPTIGIEGMYIVAVRKSDMCAVAWTSSDENGNYELSGLPAGSYYVATGVRGGFGCFRSGDGVWDDGPYIGEYLTDKPNMAAATAITLTATQSLLNQNFVLQLGATISGFVGLSDGTRGYGGLSAEAYGANDELIGWTSVEDDGSFTIQGLPAGVYYIKLSADDASMSPAWWKDSADNRRAVSVATAQAVSGVFVELNSAAVITGNIRSQNGTSVEGRIDAVDSNGTIVASTRNTLELGAGYSLTVPAGVAIKIRATVSGQEFWLGGASSMITSPPVVATEGNATYVRDVLIPEPSRISGRVTLSGAPLSGDVRLLDSAGQTVATANVTRGNYVLSGIMPGTYTVLASFGDSMVFYGNKDSLAAATYLTVSPGAVIEGINLDAVAPTAMFVPGTISLTGVPKVGTAMSVSIGTWTPAPTTVLYRWFVSDPFWRGGARRAVGTAASYTLAPGDQGKHLSLEITILKNGYVSDEAFISVGLISGLALTTSPVPTITGGTTAKVGSVLTAVPGTWAPSPVTLSYQWMKAGEPIPGATLPTYTPVAADAGARLSVRVIGTKAGYATVLKESVPTAVVGLQALTAAPIPTISGTARVGSVLSAVTGNWTPAPVGVAFQWKRNGTSIPGATGPTYLLTAEDQGRTITVAVTGSKIGFTAQTKVSAATALIAAPLAGTLTATPTPVISGTPRIDEELSVNPGTWGPAPVTLSIQWFRDGLPIRGAVGTVYKLTAGDVDATIRVQVKGTKAGYTAVTKVSAATAKIESGVLDIELASASVTGSGTIGSPLSVDFVDVYPDDVYVKYQWLRDGVPIRGAKRATYVPANRDAGCEISVLLEISKPGYGTEYLFSDSVVAYH